MKIVASLALAVAALFAVAPVKVVVKNVSVDDYLAALPDKPEPPTSYSCVSRSVNGGPTSAWQHNLTTDTASGYTNRRDWQSKALGQGPSMAFATITGNLTSISATVATNSGAAFPTAGQGLAGSIVVVSRNSSGTGTTAYGCIVSNTATALTVDQWYDATSASGAAATTPNGTGAYIILPGQNPAAWLAVTSNATGPSSADTTLTSEATSADFARAVGSWSHTAAATTYALAHTFTATSGLTVNKEAVFGAVNTTAGGVMPYESAEPSPPVLISGDTLAQTVTITI